MQLAALENAGLGVADFVWEIGSAVGMCVLGWMVDRVRRALERKHPLAGPGSVIAVFLLFAAINVAFTIVRPQHAWVALVGTTVVLFLIVSMYLRQLWRVGVIRVDSSAASGLDYKRALALCANSLDFLGIGAAKLTRLRSEFEEAALRCKRPDRPMKFLLCPPDHERLQEAARQAGRSVQEYGDAVRSTLRVLRDLRNDRAVNIEVRFYKEIPLFRLMFIDDDVCIASHYVLGDGDGSQMPQLLVRKSVAPLPDKLSLYYPLRQYFDDLWGRAKKPWDFTEFL
jgi:hypothetical protein